MARLKGKENERGSWSVGWFKKSVWESINRIVNERFQAVIDPATSEKAEKEKQVPEGKSLSKAIEDAQPKGGTLSILLGSSWEKPPFIVCVRKTSVY